MVAEHLTQCPVQQVCAGVVAPDGGPTVHVDAGLGRLTCVHTSRRDPARVPAESGQRERRVSDLDGSGAGHEQSGVAHLTAALCVEGRAVEKHLHGVVVARDDREDARIARVV